MPLFNPQKDYVQWWEFELFANAGQYRQEIILYKGNMAEIIYDSKTMGVDPRRFLLSGKYESVSDDYGLIYIESIRRATDQTLEQFTEIDVRDFNNSIALEYFCVSRSPHVQHPNDMLNVAARWTQHFD